MKLLWSGYAGQPALRLRLPLHTDTQEMGFRHGLEDHRNRSKESIVAHVAPEASRVDHNGRIRRQVTQDRPHARPRRPTAWRLRPEDGPVNAAAAGQNERRTGFREPPQSGKAEVAGAIRAQGIGPLERLARERRHAGGGHRMQREIIAPNRKHQRHAPRDRRGQHSLERDPQRMQEVKIEVREMFEQTPAGTRQG